MRSLLRPAAMALVATIVLGACGSVSPSTGPGTSATSPGSAAPSSDANTLRVAVRTVGFLSNVEFENIVTAMLFSGLYRYDEHYEPVPDLADGPCDISDGGLSFRCRIRDATFHDGSPVTASDVALGFEVLRRPTCQFWTFDCRSTKLASVEVEDARTIMFRLSEPDPSFITIRLPTVRVESRKLVEASFERLRAAAAGTDPDGIDQTATTLAEGLDAEAADCSALIDAPERALIDAGYRPWSRAEFNQGPGGSFAPCDYGWFLHDRLRDLASMLRSEGLDSLAAAYPLLDTNRAPIGTGPFRFVSLEPGTELRLAANEAYYNGRPHIDEVRVVPSWNDDQLIESVRDERLDLWLGADWWDPSREVVDAVRREPAIQVLETPTSGYDAIQLNVHLGRLFADRRLRQALELCIDKAATVDAATSGAGRPVDSYIPTGSWAYQGELIAGRRDVDAARALIESAGWTVGGDGIYRAADRRFTFDVLVREPYDSSRRKFLELMALQVRDCGIELVPKTVPFDEILKVIEPEPGEAPTADVDAVLSGFQVTYDPDEPMWQAGNNWMGFANADVDRLLAEGRSSTDLADRARIYKQLQTVLAEERPFIFAYTLMQRVIVSRAIVSDDPDLDLTAPRWWWRLEQLALER